MKPGERQRTQELTQRLFEAEATIEALFSGQIDAMVDSKSKTPLLLSQAQQALRASEEQYRQIVEATTDGIIKLDTVDRIVFVNRRFAEMLGYQPSEMIGMSVFAFMSSGTSVVVADALHARPAVPKDALETCFRHRDGSEVSVDIATSPLLDGDGGQTGNLGVVRDVTERKKLQSQLMVSDRMASVGTLAAGVAHEINNPLAAVIGNLEYVVETLGYGRERTGTSLSTEGVLEEIRSPLEDAREAAEIVRLIVLDLKIFSSSPIEGARCAVDVEAVMESSLRMARNEIRHRGRLVKAYGGVPVVEVNEARLGQVFLNLIVNAAQALPEGRAAYHEIRVTTHLDGERVVIAVSDTGAGIPPEIIGRIFDAFFTTKPVGVGTGLGLAICQRIVTDMGGGLTVASEVGRGTTFSVSLPIARQRQGTS